MTFETVVSAAAGALGVLAVRDLGGSAVASIRGTNAPAWARVISSFAPAAGSLAFVRRLSPPADLGSRLAAAGRPGGLGPREWMGLKAGCAATAAMPALVILGGGPGRLGLLLALGAPLAGFVGPDFWLARAVRARSEAAVRQLPDMLDLLRVSVEAGVSATSAIGVVGAQFDGPLAVEWRRLAGAVALGEPKDVAFRRLAERLPSEEVRGFAEALTRARRHGLPLGKTLAAQSASAREARRRRIREQAARAGPKMQLVVALVLVPSMLLIVGAVLVSELLRPGLGLAP